MSDELVFDFEEVREIAMAVARAQGAGVWAEDIASETLKKLWSRQGEVSDVRAWVRRAARNAAIDHYRRQPHAGWTTLPSPDLVDGEPAYPPELRARSVSEEAGVRDKLERVLAVLDDVERDLLLQQAAGYSTRELADAHGFTEGSVRVKLSVARRKIRNAFPGLDWQP